LPTTGNSSRRAWLDTASLALLVFSAYYLGARAGLALTFLPNPISVLWPPNAIVFSALLLTPHRRWLLVIAAVFPAHLLAELQGGVPLAMVLCWFVSNVCEGLIGALVVQALVGRPLTFDNRRDVIAFVAAAALATVLSSFADSLFVILNRWGSKDYWTLWQTRFFSNTTTALIVVPVAVTWINGGIAALRLRTRLRAIEASSLALCLAVSTLVVFDLAVPLPASPLWVYLPLPFLVWAALRFGPIGTVTSVAVVALIVIWGAGHGHGPLGSGSPLHDARSVQLLLLFVAPTLLFLAAVLEERRQSEYALRMSDSRFHLMLEATNDSVYDREMRSGRIWWSGKSLRSLGYAAEQRPASYEAWLAIVHPNDRERVLGALAAALAGGQERWQTEFRVLAHDGSYAHLHEQCFIVRDVLGKPAKIIGALADVTERRHLDELGQRLAQASRLTAMGELTASIAHEINQPMSAILSNVDAAEMLLDTGRCTDGQLREILADIRADDIRASEIILHIRGLTRDRKADVQLIAVRDVVEGVLRLVHPLAQRRRTRLTASFGGPCMAYADRIHVQQILLNLVLNSMDAMEQLPENERQVMLNVRQADDRYVEIAVADRGHGIAAGDLSQVFDSFFTTKQEGMGLGLSIARSLVEAHGGTIWASNNTDCGATFAFTLPSLRDSPHASPQPATDASSTSSRTTTA
jgi:PAS domain S-box-containing protein